MTNWHHYSWNHNHPFGWHLGTARTLQKTTHLLQSDTLQNVISGIFANQILPGKLGGAHRSQPSETGWEQPVSQMPEEFTYAQDILKWPFQLSGRENTSFFFVWVTSMWMNVSKQAVKYLWKLWLHPRKPQSALMPRESISWSYKCFLLGSNYQFLRNQPISLGYKFSSELQ